MNRRDLWLLKGWAMDEFLKLKAEEKLVGDADPISHGDRLAISYYRASVRYMTKVQGGEYPAIQMEIPDSDPEAEYADWTLAEPEEG